MEPVRFYHLYGTDLWRRCDHHRTQIHEPTATVRLATLEQVEGHRGTSQGGTHVGNEIIEQGLILRGGTALINCAPDRCQDYTVLLADPQQDLLYLDKQGWHAIPEVKRPVTPGLVEAPSRFGNATASSETSLFALPSTLAADPFGRFWLLERGAQRVRLLATDDLRVLDSMQAPPGAILVDLATDARAVIAIDYQNGQIWRMPYGGEWETVAIPTINQENYKPIAVAGHPQGFSVVLLRPEQDSDFPSYLLIIESEQRLPIEIKDLEDPLYLVMMPDDKVLIGEASTDSKRPNLFIFSRYRLEDDRLTTLDQWAVRGFDGRALFIDPKGGAYATTAKGIRALYEIAEERVTSGRVETYALDSDQFGCVWHRVFVDICLPPGTRAEISARTSDTLPLDTLPPEALRRKANPAHGLSLAANSTSADEEAVEIAWAKLPLGSRTPNDVEGWLTLGQLDRRPAQSDVPFPSEGRIFPSEDVYAPRVPQPETIELETLEGLIKNPAGRYIWLRIMLHGTARRSPALKALRVTYTRPSLLDHLPAYWRGDPEPAMRMEHALSLFEGFYTELDHRISEMRQILDPRICPPQAIEWLAQFVALTFDTRVSEAIRRQLLGEITQLYRIRGTPSGLARLCGILGECRVAIVEGFRVRRRSPAEIGATQVGEADEHRSVLGPGLQLGGPELFMLPQEPWEADLLASHLELLERRRVQQDEAGETPCPDHPLPAPFDTDPAISFYRRYAHRFSVLLFREKTADIEALIRQAIEASKPAHTLHELCWLNDGFRLGANTYVGIGTRIAGIDALMPSVVGEAPLGMEHTLSRPDRSRTFGIFVGASRLGSPEREVKAQNRSNLEPKRWS